ncbi:MAG TPA: terminase gpA endonuclease subunit [Gemmatimonadales bacterium]|nr:terminase gpA endonuclease subunit [Gemmatimonadales bacterium]
MTAPAFVDQVVVETVRRLCLVPDSLTVTEHAERYRILPRIGPYRVHVAPYQRRWQDLLADPDQSCIVLCWATQTGKSTVLENGLFYRMRRLPSPLILVRPKIDDAESWAKERFRPMVQDTPTLARLIPLGRGGETTLRYYPFPGGFLSIASAQSATELASRSSPFVFCDEVDRMEMIPGEGNPVEIVSRRQGASDVGQLGLTSTPRDAESTIIWPYLEGGTFELYYLPCPHCGERQPLIWGGKGDTPGLHWVAGQPETAIYVCRACAATIEETAKRAWYREEQGTWVPTNADGRYPSSHLNALYSPYAKSAWPILVSEWERAKGKPADLQVFVNTRLCELWTETDQRITQGQLASRLEADLEEDVVPDGVGVLTAGIDVQANRLELYVWGWGAGLESWPVAMRVFPGDPQREPDQPGSVWHEVDAALAQPFLHVSGRSVSVAAALIDSGFATTQVYRFAQPRRPRKIYASKGQPGERPILGKPTAQTKRRIPLYPVGVDTAKNEFLRSQLVETEPGPGFVHLPSWFTAEQLAQLVAEERKRRVHLGRVSYVWVKRGSDTPNEALDCRILARAALELLGSPTIAGLGAAADALSVPLGAPEDTAGESPSSGIGFSRNVRGGGFFRRRF